MSQRTPVALITHGNRQPEPLGNASERQRLWLFIDFSGFGHMTLHSAHCEQMMIIRSIFVVGGAEHKSACVTTVTRLECCVSRMDGILHTNREIVYLLWSWYVFRAFKRQLP